VSQNFVLRWVRDEALYDVWARLGELGLGDSGADTITDTVSCPGTDSCKLGITSSMGLNRAIQAKVESMNISDPLSKKIHIKMSGCPNGCGQHHLGSIGFYGASLKVNGRPMPAYVAHIGGRFDGGDLQYGTRLKVRLPAKRVPDAIEAWIKLYEEQRNDGEPFNEFFDRVGTTPFEEAARGIALPVEFNLESLEQFIDWSRSEPYQVIRGEGECAV
jgi:sulfite reductase (ferredoxin)